MKESKFRKKLRNLWKEKKKALITYGLTGSFFLWWGLGAFSDSSSVVSKNKEAVFKYFNKDSNRVLESNELMNLFKFAELDGNSVLKKLNNRHLLDYICKENLSEDLIRNNLVIYRGYLEGDYPEGDYLEDHNISSLTRGVLLNMVRNHELKESGGGGRRFNLSDAKNVYDKIGYKVDSFSNIPLSRFDYLGTLNCMIKGPFYNPIQRDSELGKVLNKI